MSVAPQSLRREIGRVGDTAAGPTLVVVAGVHGNEPAGLHALHRVFAYLEEHHVTVRGQIVGLTGNLGALAAIDKLAKAGVKTYVIGYDASVDPMLAMQLTEYAQHGGTNNFFAVQDGPSLVAQFAAITGVVAECSSQLDKKPDDANFVLVELDGKKLNLGEPNGWSINDRNVTIEGEACTTLRDGSRKHTLAVTVECVPQVLQ